jgi:hypothetical protein
VQAARSTPVTIEVRLGAETATIETVDRRVRTRPGPANDPDLTLVGDHQVVLGLLTGRLDLDAAEARGLACAGSVKVLHRLSSRQAAYNHWVSGQSP